VLLSEGAEVARGAVESTVPEELRDPSIPLIATEEVPICAVCGGHATAPYAHGYDYELRTCRNDWRFVLCTACGHVWLNPRPAVDALSVIYPPHYYAYDYEGRVHPVARWAKSRLDDRKLDTILKRLPRVPGTYLDIGCGSGRYLRAMRRRGLPPTDIHGLELDAGIVARLAKEGFSVAAKRVEDADIASGAIHLATLFHVLEHVDAPDRVMTRVAEWLSPNGIIAVETPNLDSLDRRLFSDTFWGGYHIPRHWHLFTPETLARLLTVAGLEPIATLYQPGHSFWMYSMHHRLRYGSRPRPRLARWFDPFGGVGLLAAVTALDLARAARGARTSAMLVLARRPA
jgi:2-polyprenyl-3-methyl-5-hydroxy-6-metoxy-1,4-benzoquinol methylase